MHISLSRFTISLKKQFMCKLTNPYCTVYNQAIKTPIEGYHKLAVCLYIAFLDPLVLIAILIWCGFERVAEYVIIMNLLKVSLITCKKNTSK